MTVGKWTLAILTAMMTGGLIAEAAEKKQSPAVEEHAVSPYTDPSQLDVPWPKHSHFKQPWRAYLTTKSGQDFLNGVGVAYHVPGNDKLAVRLLAEMHVRALRVEIGWGSVSWDERSISNHDRMLGVLKACKRYGIRPTLLLNAHQGVPCPVKFFRRKLLVDAPRGSRTVRLDDTRGLVVGRSGLSQLSGYWAAEAMITEIDAKTGVCKLSKPLPKDLATGSVAMATLKYLPLHPVGDKAFDETAAGWVRYALLVCDLAREAGLDEWDVEIWNELTFGTKFLKINNYYDPDIAPKPGKKAPDFLNSGGTCWELARRTIDAVKAAHPKVRCIWGFSNTTFYHCKIDRLPPHTDGQSYHPYGTGTRSLPKREQFADKPQFCLEGFTPTVDIRMPEGWAQTFLQTECLIRLLNPKARQTTPPGTKRFYHYFTEHGTVPAEAGVTGDDAAWKYKAKCALRSYCLWLNKGVDTLHYFCAHAKKPGGMGILPVDLVKLAPDAKFEDVATLPMRTVRNLTRGIGVCEKLAKTAQLDVDVVALGPERTLVNLGPRHAPLRQRDMFAVLPFQPTKKKFVLAVYVMTSDATVDMAPQTYRLTVRGLGFRPGGVKLYDPLADAPVDLRVVRRGDGEVTVELPTVDTPRLLTLEPTPR